MRSRAARRELLFVVGLLVHACAWAQKPPPTVVFALQVETGSVSKAPPLNDEGEIPGLEVAAAVSVKQSALQFIQGCAPGQRPHQVIVMVEYRSGQAIVYAAGEGLAAFRWIASSDRMQLPTPMEIRHWRAYVVYSRGLFVRGPIPVTRKHLQDFAMYRESEEEIDVSDDSPANFAALVNAIATGAATQNDQQPVDQAFADRVQAVRTFTDHVGFWSNVASDVYVQVNLKGLEQQAQSEINKALDQYANSLPQEKQAGAVGVVLVEYRDGRAIVHTAGGTLRQAVTLMFSTPGISSPRGGTPTFWRCYTRLGKAGEPMAQTLTTSHIKMMYSEIFQPPLSFPFQTPLPGTKSPDPAVIDGQIREVTQPAGHTAPPERLGPGDRPGTPSERSTGRTDLPAGRQIDKPEKPQKLEKPQKPEKAEKAAPSTQGPALLRP